MSDKTMVEILNETQSAYGEWSAVAREAARRIDENRSRLDALTERVEKIENSEFVLENESGAITWKGEPIKGRLRPVPPPAPEPAGVWVRPGMRARYSFFQHRPNQDVTIAPKGEYDRVNRCNCDTPGSVDFWDADGVVNGNANPAKYLTYNGAPVLGYAGDER